MTFSITRERIGTQLGKLVYDKLINILKDDNFILSVFFDIQGDERKKDLLNWLEKNPNATDEDVLDYIDEKYNSDL